MKKKLSLLLIMAMIVSMFSSITSAEEMTSEERFEELKEKGIFSGYEDGLSHLEDNMTRAQAVKIIALVFELDISNNPETTSFTDVDENHWSYPYVEAVYRAEIVNGIGDHKFAPNDQVTYEQFIKMFVLGFAYKTGATISQDSIVETGEVSDWALQYVATALSWGLIESQDNYTVSADRAFLVDSAYYTDEKVKEENKSNDENESEENEASEEALEEEEEEKPSGGFSGGSPSGGGTSDDDDSDPQDNPEDEENPEQIGDYTCSENNNNSGGGGVSNNPNTSDVSEETSDVEVIANSKNMISIKFNEVDLQAVKEDFTITEDELDKNILNHEVYHLNSCTIVTLNLEEELSGTTAENVLVSYEGTEALEGFTLSAEDGIAPEIDKSKFVHPEKGPVETVFSLNTNPEEDQLIDHIVIQFSEEIDVSSVYYKGFRVGGFNVIDAYTTFDYRSITSPNELGDAGDGEFIILQVENEIPSVINDLRSHPIITIESMLLEDLSGNEFAGVTAGDVVNSKFVDFESGLPEVTKVEIKDSKSLLVTFNETIKEATNNDFSLTLDNEGMPVLLPVSEVLINEIDGREVLLLFGNHFVDGEYELVIDGVKDYSGASNEVYSGSWSFNESGDFLPANLVGDGVKAISRSEIQIQFDQNLAGASQNDFKVKEDGELVLIDDLDIEDNDVGSLITLVLSVPLSGTETHNVIVSFHDENDLFLKNTTNEYNVAPHPFNAVALDGISPEVVDIEFTNDPRKFNVYFSEPIKETDINHYIVSNEKGENIPVEEVNIDSENNKKVNISLSSIIDHGKVYNLIIDEVKDFMENSNESYNEFIEFINLIPYVNLTEDGVKAISRNEITLQFDQELIDIYLGDFQVTEDGINKNIDHIEIEYNNIGILVILTLDSNLEGTTTELIKISFNDDFDPENDTIGRYGMPPYPFENVNVIDGISPEIATEDGQYKVFAMDVDENSIVDHISIEFTEVMDVSSINKVYFDVPGEQVLDAYASIEGPTSSTESGNKENSNMIYVRIDEESLDSSEELQISIDWEEIEDIFGNVFDGAEDISVQ
ncbi:S-layer homology domain-containing protein [Chengkuizengella axinellae]|uniref:S-layer homology domain-containing protein n=1 Tax=Chengkuizengella axinellae TaxID=3064388 RepID=A0ABT9IYU0_9BACL|nr:S-layer homology domain-containing protein [Chengkuizengella sp. 2205SS18-9]MDP5274534.1 S-layer homology domain-containing protein [Chengkuizengella sp. 2205SS18-9]